MGHVLSDFRKAEIADWVQAAAARPAPTPLPLLAAGEDERYQAEVLRLAPAPKLDPQGRARGEARLTRRRHGREIAARLVRRIA